MKISPSGAYGDVLEQALYNGVLSGMALDGKSFFYVNPLEVVPEACQKDQRKKACKAYPPKMVCLRLLSSQPCQAVCVYWRVPAFYPRRNCVHKFICNQHQRVHISGAAH